MQLRRSSALVAGVIVLVVLGLSSCGFGQRTQQVYTPAVGVNDRDGEVDVLGAVVVAAQPGSGTFIASLANNDTTDVATFDGITGAEGNAIVPDDYAAIEIGPRDLVNLAVVGGPTLTGEFVAGDFLPMTVNFAEGNSVTLDVPVVTACGDFEGLDESTDETAAEDAYSCEQEAEAEQEAGAEE